MQSRSSLRVHLCGALALFDHRLQSSNILSFPLFIENLLENILEKHFRIWSINYDFRDVQRFQFSAQVG